MRGAHGGTPPYSVSQKLNLVSTDAGVSATNHHCWCDDYRCNRKIHRLAKSDLALAESVTKVKTPGNHFGRRSDRVVVLPAKHAELRFCCDLDRARFRREI